MIEIRTEADLERAVQEFQSLTGEDGGDDGPNPSRRAELDAAIKAFYAQRSQSLDRGKPEHVLD